MNKPQEAIVGYFPVFHAGYLQLLDAHPGADIGVLGSDVLNARFDYLRKDIRALAPEQAAEIIAGLKRNVRLIGERGLLAAMNTPQLIMPNDDISHQLAAEFDIVPEYDPIFLRWDRENSTVNKPVEPDRVVSVDVDDSVIRMLFDEKEKSTNWWRHLAAAIIRDNEVLAATHNSSLPTTFSSAIDNDPRITARRGSSIEISIDIHAEARAIADLARRGIATQDAVIFVTTFPCPNCAKLIAESGISSCYFIEGYAMLDGQSILKTNGVDIIKIDVPVPTEDRSTLKPYPSSQS